MGLKYQRIEKYNAWELHVKFMHGDADYYTTSIIEFDKEKQLIEKVKIIQDRLNFQEENYNDSRITNDEWCIRNNDWLEAGYNLMADRFAILDSYKIYFWDKNGIKFKATFSS